MDFFLQGGTQVAGRAIEAAAGMVRYASAVEMDVVDILESVGEAGGKTLGQGAREGEKGVGCG